MSARNQPVRAPAASALESSLITLAMLQTIVLGVALGGWALMRAFGEEPLPFKLTLALVGGGVLEIALGAGLLRRARGAWAFAMSLNAMLAVVGVFALPAIARGGVYQLLGGFGLLMAVGIVVMLARVKDSF